MLILGLRKTPNTELRTSNRAPIGNWSLVMPCSLGIGIYSRATFPTTKPPEKLGSFVTISILSNGWRQRRSVKFSLGQRPRHSVTTKRQR